MKLLIADDDERIVSVLSEYCGANGYKYEAAFDGEETIELFRKGDFDLILLDIAMPKKDGFQVCREIRRVSDIPIVIVTARDEPFERVMGLDIGADDYILKPFSPAEVMARVRAILRRTTTDTAVSRHDKFIYDNLMICLDDFTVMVNDRKISLTKKEIELLWIMATNQNKVFTRDNLLDSVWGYDYFGDNRTVDSHIKRLRAKLGQAEHPRWEIKTVWGMGYKFEAA